MVVAERKQLPDIKSEFKPKPAFKTKAALKKCVLLTLVVLAGFALCMLYTYQATRIIALGYQADKLQNSVNKLQGENKQLGLKIAELQAPERVQQIATTKLGMKEPQEFMIAFSTPEQLSSQQTQVQAVSPKNSWSSRLLAAIPRLIGQAEASPR